MTEPNPNQITARSLSGAINQLPATAPLFAKVHDDTCENPRLAVIGHKLVTGEEPSLTLLLQAPEVPVDVEADDDEETGAEDSTVHAVEVLSDALREDLEFAKSWQANLAMPIFDNAAGRLTHKEANIIADALMSNLFGVTMCSAGSELETAPLAPNPSAARRNARRTRTISAPTPPTPPTNPPPRQPTDGATDTNTAAAG